MNQDEQATTSKQIEDQIKVPFIWPMNLLINFKPFVKESEELSPVIDENKFRSELSFVGLEAKEAYETILLEDEAKNSDEIVILKDKPKATYETIDLEEENVDDSVEIIVLEDEDSENLTETIDLEEETSKNSLEKSLILKENTSESTNNVTHEQNCNLNNISSISSLFTATQSGDIKYLETYLNKNNVNARDECGWTLLMYCACNGNLSIFKLLLRHGADKEAEDNFGMTALQLALENNHSQISKLLKLLTSKKQQTSKIKKSKITTKSEKRENFYCNLCKTDFQDTSRKKHESSILHIFNSEPNVVDKTSFGIPMNNKGYQMMLKNGWDENRGLGPRGDGRKYPIKTILKRNREGLGKSKVVPRVTHFAPGDTSAVKPIRRKKPYMKKNVLKLLFS